MIEKLKVVTFRRVNYHLNYAIHHHYFRCCCFHHHLNVMTHLRRLSCLMIWYRFRNRMKVNYMILMV